MNQQHPCRSVILPVSPEASRPLWSVMIPTYNCANYLRETLKSVLAQDPGADMMQIEVVDDCSTQDDPEAVVEELGGDRVRFYRQPQNVGHIRNFQTCLERAHGQRIHLLHGDDCIRPGFYQKMHSIFKSNPEIGAAFCRHIHMNEKGHWHYISSLEQPESGILQNWLEKIAVRQRIQTPSMVVRRDVYEKLDGFDSRLSWTEDWEMWVRIAAHYPVGYEVEPLALYRQHSSSSTSKKVQTGEDIQDLRRAISLIKDYLPDDRMNALTQQALKNYALYALQTAQLFILNDDKDSALNQIREAIQCNTSSAVLYAALKLKLRALSLTLRSQAQN